MTTNNEAEEVDERLVFATAALTLQAGLALGSGDAPLQPPTFGWMPPPATGAPEVEFGAALAVNALIRAAGMVPEDVEKVRAQLLEQAK